MKRVIIVGSPRANGRSAHLAEMLFEANIDERPEDELYLVPISEIDVDPCIGCNACRKKTEVTFRDDEGNEVTELRHRCIFDDDMQTLYDLLDEADVLTVVCPVYFSGTPGPMKCALDRLQPYFWDYCENGPRLPKRPLELHVIGEGGDPHGYAPLISEVKSPTLLAGFALERIFDWVGKISPEGEILEEAEEIDPSVALGVFTGSQKSSANAENASDPDESAHDMDESASSLDEFSSGVDGQPKPYSERPKLSFSGLGEKAPAQTPSQSKGKAQGQSQSRTQGKTQGQSLGKAQSQSRSKAKGQSQGKAQNNSRGKSQNKPQSKSQGQSRGQASKQTRGRSSKKDGRRG